MGRITEEHSRLYALMESVGSGPQFAQLYAAQHALNWVLNPERFGAPFDYITGIEFGSPDCLTSSRPAPSKDTGDRMLGVV